MSRQELIRAAQVQVTEPIKNHHITSARLAGLVRVHRRVGPAWLYEKGAVDGLIAYMHQKRRYTVASSKNLPAAS